MMNSDDAYGLFSLICIWVVIVFLCWSAGHNRENIEDLEHRIEILEAE